MVKVVRPEVFEKAGVWAALGPNDRWVTVEEATKGEVRVSVGDYQATMTSDAARTLARQLWRVAKRADAK